MTITVVNALKQVLINPEKKFKKLGFKGIFIKPNNSYR